jgi:hypothetical protein
MQAGGAAGATYSLPLLENLRVGLLFDASYTPNLGLTIGSAIKSVIDTCESPSGCEVHAGDAFQKKMLLQLKPALAASWAPTHALGVTGNVAYVYASTDINGSTSTSNALQIATAVDYDFAAISSVPIGLQVQFNWLAPSGGGLQHVTDLGGGVFYTGKKELALGVQVLARQFRVNPDVNVSWNTYIAIIGMRYYW